MSFSLQKLIFLSVRNEVLKIVHADDAVILMKFNFVPFTVINEVILSLTECIV